MLEARLVELYLACTQPWLPFLAACELDMMMQVCRPSTRKMGEESEQFKDILGYLASSSPARGLCETLPQKPKLCMWTSVGSESPCVKSSLVETLGIYRALA